MTREQERRREGGYGKPVAQLDQEWQSYLQDLVDEGVYATVDEAERKVIAEYEEERRQRREDRL